MWLEGNPCCNSESLAITLAICPISLPMLQSRALPASACPKGGEALTLFGWSLWLFLFIWWERCINTSKDLWEDKPAGLSAVIGCFLLGLSESFLGSQRQSIAMGHLPRDLLLWMPTWGPSAAPRACLILAVTFIVFTCWEISRCWLGDYGCSRQQVCCQP